MPEGLGPAEVGEKISEHKERHEELEEAEGKRHERRISIAEALLLSLVALMAAWSGYSAAKWGTESSLSLARSSSTRSQSNRADIEATQVRTLDAVTFNAAFTAYADHDAKLFDLAVKRFRPGYRVAFEAWLATRPLKNPNAPPGPAYMPQYHVPQDAQGRALAARADRLFAAGQSAASTADKYVRLTVFLAAVLFLVGISSHFPVRTARYGLIATATVLFVVSLVQLAALPGPPA
jgi:hypothetical protein